MTSWQLRPGGLYIPPGAADGPYLVQKDGNRFSQWLRLVDGDNTTVVTDPDAGTVQVDSTGGGSGGAGEPHIDTDTATTGVDLVMTLTVEPSAPEALLVFWRGVGLDPTQYSYVGTGLTVLDQGWTTGDLVWAAYWSEVPTVVTDPTTTLGDLLVRGPSGLTRLPVGPDTYVLTADSGATDGLDWEPPTGGGGGSSDFLTPAPADLNPTYGDHFTGASLDAKWNRVGYVAGDEQYQKGDATYLQVDVGRAAANYYWQAAPSGDFTVVMGLSVLSSATGIMFGPMILDSSGNGMQSALYSGSDGYYVLGCSAAAYNSTAQTVAGEFYHSHVAGQKYWLKLTKVGTAYKASFSSNGQTWGKYTATLTFGTTPTRIGFGSIFGTVPQFAIDFFDVQ